MGRNNKIRRKRKHAQKAAQKKRRREQPKIRSKDQNLAPKFYKFQDPLEGLSHDQRRLAIEEIARNSEEKYQETLSELRAILRRQNPILVLSYMSYYGLIVAVR